MVHVSDRAFKFDTCIPWDETFSLVPWSSLSVKAKVRFQGDHLKTLTVAGIFLFNKYILLLKALVNTLFKETKWNHADNATYM